MKQHRSARKAWSNTCPMCGGKQEVRIDLHEAGSGKTRPAIIACFLCEDGTVSDEVLRAHEEKWTKAWNRAEETAHAAH